MGITNFRISMGTKILLIILIVLLVIAAIVVISKNKKNEKNEKDVAYIVSGSDNKNLSFINTNQNGNIEEEIFYEYYEKAEELIKSMSLEEKVGQMFLASYEESDAIKETKEQAPGGYILVDKDFQNKTKESMLNELTKVQEESKVNLLLAVSEEGGTAVQVSRHTQYRNTRFLSPQTLWGQGQLVTILNDSIEKSALLKSIGINMNLAPVADIPTNYLDYMYARSYGRGTDRTAIYISELVKTMNESEMVSTMKHFPGYGNNPETKEDIIVDNRSYETFKTSEFLPFESGIEARGPSILVCHNLVKSIDEEMPSSLSKKTNQILREELYFSGLVISENISMKALEEYAKNGEVAVFAVLAGNDMIISSNFKEDKEQIVKAIKEKRIEESVINTAVRRILACKYAYGII